MRYLFYFLFLVTGPLSQALTLRPAFTKPDPLGGPVDPRWLKEPKVDRNGSLVFVSPEGEVLDYATDGSLIQRRNMALTFGQHILFPPDGCLLDWDLNSDHEILGISSDTYFRNPTLFDWSTEHNWSYAFLLNKEGQTLRSQNLGYMGAYPIVSALPNKASIFAFTEDPNHPAKLLFFDQKFRLQKEWKDFAPEEKGAEAIQHIVPAQDRVFVQTALRLRIFKHSGELLRDVKMNGNYRAAPVLLRNGTVAISQDLGAQQPSDPHNSQIEIYKANGDFVRRGPVLKTGNALSVAETSSGDILVLVDYVSDVSAYLLDAQLNLIRTISSKNSSRLDYGQGALVLGDQLVLKDGSQLRIEDARTGELRKSYEHYEETFGFSAWGQKVVIEPRLKAKGLEVIE